jgi:hypothetical protein
MVFQEAASEPARKAKKSTADCTAAVQSEKVWYVESCLRREPKGIASFPASASSLRHYSIRRNYQEECTFKGRVSSAVSTSFSFKAANCMFYILVKKTN